jgi:hypothetical protein
MLFARSRAGTGPIRCQRLSALDAFSVTGTVSSSLAFNHHSRCLHHKLPVGLGRIEREIRGHLQHRRGLSRFTVDCSGHRASVVRSTSTCSRPPAIRSSRTPRIPQPSAATS